MARDEGPRSMEDVFNENLDKLLEARGLQQRDLLELLQDADYTPDTPATVLLNDAVAMAAVLGVSPIHLLLPAEEEPVSVTPAIVAEREDVSLWLRGLHPLRDEDFAPFHAQASREDLDAERIAEMWVRSERLRTAGLTIALNQAVDRRDMERVKVLEKLAALALDQQALERAEKLVPRSVRNGELQAAVTRATRFRRQGMPHR